MENCVFCKIIKGEIPAAKVWEDENYLAFLSIEPINDGHTLVIPKRHIPYLFDMEDKDLGGLIAACKPIAKALKEAFNPATGKIGVEVVGVDVPHVHVHLIPLNTGIDMTPCKPTPEASQEDLQKNAERVKAALFP